MVALSEPRSQLDVDLCKGVVTSVAVHDVTKNGASIGARAAAVAKEHQGKACHRSPLRASMCRPRSEIRPTSGLTASRRARGAASIPRRPVRLTDDALIHGSRTDKGG